MTRSNITLKAVLAICMAALVALAIAGCSSSSQSSGSASSSASSASASAESAASDASSDASSDTAGKSSSQSSSAASASASTSSSSSIATGTLVDVTNKTPGYTFKTDKGYDVKLDGEDTHVYTGSKSGAVPYFELTVMKNSTNRSIEDYLSSIGNDAAQKYKDTMVVTPFANSVTLHDRTVKGIEYARKNDAGDKELAVMVYVEQYSGSFWTWRTICYMDDTETPAAMEEAMDTFKFLAS